MIKNMYCYCRRLRFVYKYSHDGSQISETPVPGALISSSDLWILGTHVVYIHTCRQNIRHIKLNKTLKKKPDVEAQICNYIPALLLTGHQLILCSISNKRDVALTQWKRRTNF